MRSRKLFTAAAVFLALLSGGAGATQAERKELLDYDTRDVLESLQEAVTLHDEIKTLQPSRLFGRDQSSARSDLDEMLDEAMALFESSRINELRSQYRALEVKIAEQQRTLSMLRAERVLAPAEDESLKSKLIPGDTLKRMVASTRGDYDRLIISADTNLKAYQSSQTEVVEALRIALDELGLSLSEAQLQSLLASVVGDDMVQMTVVFNSIREVTGQLVEMVAASGEDLAYSKQYYGMVVVLHRMVGLMQEQFIHDVKNEYLPKLESFREAADANIQASRNLMRGGDNRATLQANIEANQLTRQVVGLYMQILQQQLHQVGKALEVNRRQQAVAENTYDTVALSSNVVSMIRQGGRTFDQLVALQMPDVRVFKNERMLNEFRRLTAELKSD
ncbi:hypothetical protein [Marinobacterium weihaiense]|uniref:Uncharacterized protein n=1 Tax=Marinobacterium weihaiense TaxID=2851016 RepID=A0ABS6MBC7_9GAMM|nr:hypothetical protein [Marinobacterium weihaiense]MBV0933017.1 hypothetical protein [Marinobacterium weihaiense]